MALAIMLAGCGEGRPPSPTPEQNAQLNEAEAMLDEEAGDRPSAPEADGGQR